MFIDRKVYKDYLKKNYLFLFDKIRKVFCVVNKVKYFLIVIKLIFIVIVKDCSEF